MHYYVYYEYDFYEEGGIGFREFETKQKALDFIQSAGYESKDVNDDFVLIEGKRLPLEVVEVIKKVQIKQGRYDGT